MISLQTTRLDWHPPSPLGENQHWSIYLKMSCDGYLFNFVNSAQHIVDDQSVIVV